jgi:hypothetical protein
MLLEKFFPLYEEKTDVNFIGTSSTPCDCQQQAEAAYVIYTWRTQAEESQITRPLIDQES